MIRRWGRYAAAYPLSFFAAFGLALGLGLTALLAAGSGHPGWRPDAGVAVTVLTIAVNMLVMRAVDDLRDLEYDQIHNPKRPLARGAVSRTDLGALIAVGAAGLLLLNAWRGWPAAMLLAVFGYAAFLLVLELRWRWPADHRMLLSLLVNCPVQVLLAGYVYAGFLTAQGSHPSGYGWPAIAAAIASILHLEFARRVTRSPAAGERTYVHELGVTGTAVVAVGCAVLAVTAALVVLRPWGAGSAWGWLVVAALVAPAVAAARFRAGADRWPLGPTALFPLGLLLAAIPAGLAGGS